MKQQMFVMVDYVREMTVKKSCMANVDLFSTGFLSTDFCQTLYYDRQDLNCTI